jgi:hypothetical protein
VRLLRLAKGNTGGFSGLKTAIQQVECCHLAPIGTVDEKDLILAKHGKRQQLLGDKGTLPLLFGGRYTIAPGKLQPP